MRRLLLVAAFVAAAWTAGAQCPTGDASYASGVWVVFTKFPDVPPPAVQVRWFKSNGDYAGSFSTVPDVPSAGNPLKNNFPPARVYIDSDLTAGCVSGAPAWVNNRCYARFELPWADSTYTVEIDAPAPYRYAIHRSAPRNQPKSVCTQTLETTSQQRFSSDETLEVTFFKGRLSLLTSTVNLRDGPRDYEIDESTLSAALQKAESHGQTGGALSPNAQWLVANKKARVSNEMRAKLSVVRVR